MDSRNNKLKITEQNQWIALTSLLIFAIFILIGLIWLILKDSDALLIESMLIVCSIGFSLNALPVLYLHRQYFQVNKGEEYVIEEDKIIRWKMGKREEFLAKDISKIVIRKPMSMEKGGMPILGIESYYCVDVYLKAEMYDDLTLDRLNKPELTLTCFLSPKIDYEARKLKNVRFERIKSGFNTVKSKIG